MNQEIHNGELLDPEPRKLLAVEFARTLAGVENYVWDEVVILDNTPTRVQVEINTLIRPFSLIIRVGQDGDLRVWGVIESPESLIVHYYSRPMDPTVAELRLKGGLSRPRQFTEADIDHTRSAVRPTSVFPSSYHAADFLAKLASAITGTQKGSS